MFRRTSVQTDRVPGNHVGLPPEGQSVDSGNSLGRRLAARDEKALAEAYAAYAPGVLAYVTRFVGADEAEDVVQRTFLDAWRSASRYDPQRRFSSWLFTIAHHRAVDALRSRRHDVVDVDTARHLVGEDGRETAQRYADAAEVQAWVQQLPEHERVVIELVYFAQLTQAETARHLDLPLGTVKARCSRATHRIGLMLRDDSSDASRAHDATTKGGEL